MRRRDFIAAIGSAGVAWPVVARAQKLAVPVIGYLNPGAETDSTIKRFTAAFRQGLGEQGYIEGRNVEILYRWAEGRYDRLPALAMDLVRRKVAVIYCASLPAALAAKSTTAAIPIVFWTNADPVKIGLVASLNRPGGNVTGVTPLGEELTGKRLELLHEIAPAVRSVGFFFDSSNPASQAEMREGEIAARALGLRLVTADAKSDNEAAFRSLAEERIGAVLTDSSISFFDAARNQLLAWAARNGVPAIYTNREMVESGGLMSYGPSSADANRITSIYVGRILKGEKPGDLPVQQSTRIEMVLNLKTAKTLGIEVPTATLLRATEVIE